jgi:hypothetical protein
MALDPACGKLSTMQLESVADLGVAGKTIPICIEGGHGAGQRPMIVGALAVKLGPKLIHTVPDAFPLAKFQIALAQMHRQDRR